MPNEKETRTAKTIVLLTKSLKDKAIKRAEQERRTLSDYVFQLILEDVEKHENNK